MGKKKKKLPGNIIAQNKKARHDYALETEYEAG
ncbi:MAG: SsrA-binding protein, partial [Gammaproteobacteria bacterium]|nr:SsrA-binding protein [Gammaproteobacteria bacterium]